MSVIRAKPEQIIQTFDEQHPGFRAADGTHPLKRSWVLWSHPPASRSNNWQLNGYVKHSTIKTVEDFWHIFNGLRSLAAGEGDLWFLMAEGIPPIWEDEVNVRGGSYKFKIAYSDIDHRWLILAMHLVTENMCHNPEKSQYITGITVSPKTNGFCTLSIWVSDGATIDCEQFPSNIKGIRFNKSLYDPHLTRKKA